MTGQSAGSLWAQLQGAGLVQGEMPPPGDIDSPWYFRVLQGFAGWFAAFFLLGFVGIAFEIFMESALASMTAGALLCAAAALLFRARADSDFACQFAFAISLTGQAMILFGIGRLFEAELRAITLLVVAVQALLFALIGNFLHRVWSATCAALAAVLALGAFELYSLTPGVMAACLALTWLNEFRWPPRASAARALGYGLAIAALVYLYSPPQFWTWPSEAQDPGGQLIAPLLAPRIGQGLSVCLLGAALLWTAFAMLRRQAVAMGSRPGLAMLGVAVLLAVLSYKAPGVGITCLLLVVGFAHGNAPLAGLGVVALLAYLSQYYYLMQVSLLEKSLWLMGTGLSLLLARLALRWVWPASPAGSGGDA